MDAILDRFRLDGRVAYVTGGGQGIGRAYCRALAGAGAKVAVVDKDDVLAAQVATQITCGGGDAMVIPADVTNEKDVELMMLSILKAWGKLTIAVNNAGIGLWSAAETTSLHDWHHIINLNLNSVYLCARAAGRVMLEAGYGKIINTASMSAHISNTPQQQSAYNTSKAGVLHLTRSLAAEWGGRGVRVNSISPGYTKTPMVEDLIAGPEGRAMLNAWLEKIPLRRLAEARDLQGAVVYLASEASDYMNGADMLIDGGYCCW